MRTWNIKRTTFTVSDFLSWSKDGSLHLSPSFQRRPVWKKKAKSYFIDTILNGLPVPLIFLREQTDISTMKTIREVVDGQQRLRTVISFIDPNAIDDFDNEKDSFPILKVHSKKQEDLTFEELSDNERHRILSYQFSVDVLPADTDDPDVLTIFARMNSTGTKLNDQELRNAEYFGEFKSSSFEMGLSQLERWRSWKIFGEQDIARMNEVELTSELFMLILEGIHGKNKESIDGFYDKYDENYPYRKIVEDRFEITLDEIDKTLGGSIKNTNFSKKALFYPLFAAFYDSMYGIGSELNKKKPNPVGSAFKKKLMSADAALTKGSAKKAVLEASQRRTTHVGSRKTLADFLQSKN